MNYDRTYAEVILSRWDKTPEEEKRRASLQPNRQGQLSGDEPDFYALHDTWKYQRGHADVFREVYRECLETDAPSPLREGEHLLVIDIGAGAATVAVALSEVLDRNELQQVDYLAFDPHPMMRELGTHVLEHLGSGFRSAKYVDSLEEIDFGGPDRLLFALSYVVHQRSVDNTDIVEWVNLIKRAMDEVDRGIELIYTTASGLGRGAHDNLRRSLKRTRIRRRPRSISVQVPHIFPGSDWSDGQISWDRAGGMQKLQAEHWTLRR